MKQELLENLIRYCIREVRSKLKIDTGNDIRGAAAPPADGQGTGDQPAIPKDKETIDEDLQKIIKKLVNNILDNK